MTRRSGTARGLAPVGLRGSALVLGIGMMVVATLTSTTPASADTVGIKVFDAQVTETLSGGATAAVQVGLSAASAQFVTVDYATRNGTAKAPDDYTAAQGTLVFAPGTRVRSIAVDVASDGVGEGTEAFGVVLSNPRGAQISDGVGRVRILEPGQYTVPVSGAPLADVVIDPTGTHAFATNSSLNEVEVLDLETGALEAPIFVGSRPQGIDITPDGSRLYVANSGATNVSVVDVATRTELHRIPTPSGFSNDTPFSIAIADNGKAFLSTTFAGSGFGAQMLQINLATEVVTKRTDFFIGGSTTEATYLEPSFDHSRIGIVAGDISSGPVFTYTASTDTFSPEKDLAAFVDYIAVDQTGSRFLVDPGTYVLDGSLNLEGTIFGGGSGVAVEPDGLTGYRINGSVLEVLDVDRFLVSATVPLQDSTGFRPVLAVDSMAKVAVALTSSGFTVQQL